jgi:hypothetical protein
MKTYGELTEQEQEQFCSSLLVLTKNSVSEILGRDYPIYDKIPAQILKDIKNGEWFVNLPYKEVFNKEFDAVLAKAIKLSWNYNN